MYADFAFLLSLALRMAVSAAFVVTASIITESSGPVIGALIATLPLSAGPAYVFLALDHNATFIAKGAQAGLAINAATMAFCLTYVALAQRSNAIISVGGAVVVWIALAALEGLVTWTLFGGVLANAVAFAICIPLFRRFQHLEKVPLVAHYWYDIPLRATMVAALVAIVVALGRPLRQRRHRAIPDRSFQHDADPACPYRRKDNGRYDRQRRLGDDGVRRCNRSPSSHCGSAGIGACAQPRVDDLYRLESCAVVAGAKTVMEPGA